MLEHYKQDRGTLSYVSFSDLEFTPKRMFFVHNVPKGEIRGCHGHRTGQQYITCIKGKIRVKLVSKDKIHESTLLPGDYIFLDKMVWGEQQYLTGDDVAHVLCSNEFDENDYIYDLNEILEGVSDV